MSRNTLKALLNWTSIHDKVPTAYGQYEGYYVMSNNWIPNFYEFNEIDVTYRLLQLNARDDS